MISLYYIQLDHSGARLKKKYDNSEIVYDNWKFYMTIWKLYFFSIKYLK